MATTLDRTVPPVAQRLIQQFGSWITLIYPGGDGTYDPETGTVTGADPVEVRVKAVVTAYADHLAGESSGVKWGDRKAMVAARDLSDAPDTTVRVVIDGHEHTVVKVDTIYSGEKPAAYAMQVRR